MGPTLQRGELKSAFRMRYFTYCVKWLAAFAPLLLGLVAFAPKLDETNAYVLIPLYMALYFATGACAVATGGFLIGAWWARKLEKSAPLSQSWKQLIAVVGAAILIALSLLSIYLVVKGVALQAIPLPTRGESRTVFLATEPLTYALCMTTWCTCAISFPYYALQGIRRAYAT